MFFSSFFLGAEFKSLSILQLKLSLFSEIEHYSVCLAIDV